MQRHLFVSQPSSWAQRLRTVFESLGQALLPARCLFCGGACAHDGICAGCLRDLPGGDTARCPLCAIDLPSAQVCGTCLRRPPAFDHARAAFTYAFPLDAAILRLKYASDLTLVAPLGALLARLASREPQPDLLVPMPLSIARLRARGFNQAIQLAGLAARRHALPLAPGIVRRVRDTPPQASLPWEDRARNVRGAFECTADLTGLRVAIVDDVMTTGATMEALALELRRKRAREVVAWVLARTPRP